MRHLIESKAVLSLSPNHVAGYLRGRGWSDGGKYGPYGQLYRLETSERGYEALLPRTLTGDFGRRMAELINLLAQVENRDPSSVLFDLTLTPFDVIRVRSKQADGYGSIKFEDGLVLHEEAKKSLVSAAISEVSERPRKALKGRRPDVVGQYIDRLRLGQTENASFSMTILSPYSFEPPGQMSLLKTDALGRRISLRYGSALAAIRQALTESIVDTMAAFEQAVPNGVSAELCQSLAKLADNDDGIDVSVSWSPAKPVSTPVKISLTRQESAVLQEVALTFSRQEPEPDYVIEGLVEMIREDPKEYSGSYVIQAPLHGEFGVRKIRVEFGPDDRKNVYDAAKEKKWIRVVGDLQKDGKSLVLLHPREFSVIDPEDID